MGQQTLAATDGWKKKRDELTSKRNSLFRNYSRNPQDLHLALEIKTIDDEIAEYTDKMREETVRSARDDNKGKRPPESAAATGKPLLP
jgi:hypothetical protein